MAVTRDTPMSRKLSERLQENGQELTPIYTLTGMARRCNVVTQTVRRWIEVGRITPDLIDVETGRVAFSQAAVEQFLAEYDRGRSAA